MSAVGLLSAVITGLEDAGIPHMLVGSFAKDRPFSRAEFARRRPTRV